jgi:hypothetical protein
MITLRKSEDRGHANHGWLNAKHSFSFARYIDRQHMGHSALRVINQDIVQGGTGFAAHPHDNMEILTYVLRGAITHRDSMGNEERLPAGEFQLMSAGTGVTHSEMNRDPEELELLQIWLLPNEENAEPRYQQKRFPTVEGLQLVVSPDGEQESLLIRQDAYIWHGRLPAHQAAEHRFVGLHGWVQVISGELALNDTMILQAGDGAALTAEESLALRAHTASEFLLFDLP